MYKLIKTRLKMTIISYLECFNILLKGVQYFLLGQWYRTIITFSMLNTKGWCLSLFKLNVPNIEMNSQQYQTKM